MSDEATVGEVIAAFLEEWLGSVRASVRPSTYATYATLCRKHLAPAVGTIPLQQLSGSRLNKLLRRSARGRPTRRQGPIG